MDDGGGRLKDFSIPGRLPPYFTTLYAVRIIFTRGIIFYKQFVFILNISDI